jgi:hypothetical protein
MVTQLRDPEIAAHDTIYDAVLRIDSTRPIALKGMLEWLGFANAAVRIADGVFYKLSDSRADLRIILLPIRVVGPRLRRKR